MKALLLITESAILMLLATMLVGCRRPPMESDADFVKGVESHAHDPIVFSNCQQSRVDRNVDWAVVQHYQCDEGEIILRGDYLDNPATYGDSSPVVIGNTGSISITQHSDSKCVIGLAATCAHLSERPAPPEAK